jgi:hypothetical protein
MFEGLRTKPAGETETKIEGLDNLIKKIQEVRDMSPERHDITILEPRPKRSILGDPVAFINENVLLWDDDHHCETIYFETGALRIFHIDYSKAVPISSFTSESHHLPLSLSKEGSSLMKAVITFYMP